jgi:hypothetical protein
MKLACAKGNEFVAEQNLAVRELARIAGGSWLQRAHRWSGDSGECHATIRHRTKPSPSLSSPYKKEPHARYKLHDYGCFTARLLFAGSNQVGPS